MPRISNTTGEFEKLLADEIKTLAEARNIVNIIRRNTGDTATDGSYPLHTAAKSLVTALDVFNVALADHATPAASQKPPDAAGDAGKGNGEAANQAANQEPAKPPGDDKSTPQKSPGNQAGRNASAASAAAKLLLLAVLVVGWLVPESIAQDFQGVHSRGMSASMGMTPAGASDSQYRDSQYQRPVYHIPPPGYQSGASYSAGCRITRAQLLQERYDMKRINYEWRYSQIKRLTFEQYAKLARDARPKPKQ